MRKVQFFFFAGIMSTIFAANANAWQITLSDAYDVSGYKAYDISFEGLATDNPELINLSVGYDLADVIFTTVQFYDYDNGAFPVAETTWQGGSLPYANVTEYSMVYNIMGEEPLGTDKLFYPVATGETLLFTLYFQTVSDGNFDDSSVYFTYGSDLTPLAGELVVINEIEYGNHDLNITADTISTSAVPVPAAAWLLGSGLMGLVGLRRKTTRA